MKNASCWKKLALLVVLAVLLGMVPAQAAGGVTYEFAFAVHAISDNRYIRHVGPDAESDQLGSDEYYAIYLTIHNNCGTELSFSTAALTIDEKGSYFNGRTLQDGGAVSYYLGYQTTKNITPGQHVIRLLLDGKAVFSHIFKMPRNWNSVMNLPTEAQLHAPARYRAPYIGYYTHFPESGGFYEYSVDLRMDYDPIHTYICPLDWWLDLSSLESQYAKVWSDYGGAGGGYCGFQVWDDGTTAVIMTLWDVFCQDYAGNVKQIKARVVYPENTENTDFNGSGEGSFVHHLYPIEWEAGRDYRLLLQQSNGDNGNVYLTLWVMDLELGNWTKLFCFDTGMKNIRIRSAGGFVESTNPVTATSVRSLEFWNVRAHMANSGQWVNARDVTYHVNASVGQLGYEGSYNFGRDDGSCWIITSGVSDLCNPNDPAQKYPVPATESGRPY